MQCFHENVNSYGSIRLKIVEVCDVCDEIVSSCF